LKALIKAIIPIKYRQHWVILHFRRWLNFNFILRKKLLEQLTYKNKDASKSGNNGLRIFVPIIETSHYQHFQILILAKALQLRGANVKILICGEYLDGCEIKSVRNEKTSDPCLSCRFNAKHILHLFNFEVVSLTDYITESERVNFREEAASLATQRDCKISRHGMDLSQAINDSVIRYFYGAVPDNKELVDRVRKAHTMTALLCSEVAHRVDNTWQPDVVFSNMSVYSAWEPFSLYYQNNGNRFNTVTMSALNYNSLLINLPALFQSTKRFEKYVKFRRDTLLNEEETNELKLFVNNRKSGEDRYFKNYAYYKNFTEQKIYKKINLNKAKRNLFLFSNVYWDTVSSERNKLFNSVLDWVLSTIEIIKENHHCHLYIKPHPAEILDSSSSLKGVLQVIKERYPVLPSNITIIEPKWKINTYDLFSYIDLGVIFNGTIGLEMMLSDIPVVSTGKTPYQGLRFSMEPETVEQYHAILLGNQQPPLVDKEQLELFAYFYFIKTKIPWTLTKQAYADNFDGFTINSLDDLKSGKDPYLDHLCNCIMDAENTVIEAW
jgi:hypothetical protein